MECSDGDISSDGRLLLRQLDKQSPGGGLRMKSRKHPRHGQPSFESDDANFLKESLIKSWQAISRHQITRFCVAGLRNSRLRMQFAP